MLIPRGTSFLFRCTHHEATLEGTPKFKHPTPEATAVWGFDFSDMECPEAKGMPFPKGCKQTWEVRA